MSREGITSQCNPTGGQGGRGAEVSFGSFWFWKGYPPFGRPQISGFSGQRPEGPRKVPRVALAGVVLGL